MTRQEYLRKHYAEEKARLIERATKEGWGKLVGTREREDRVFYFFQNRRTGVPVMMPNLSGFRFD